MRELAMFANAGGGVSVGKVAIERRGGFAKNEQNALTCMFVLVKICCSNKLQVFRHLGVKDGGLKRAARMLCKLSDI